MADGDRLILPTDVSEALAELYFLFPFTKQGPGRAVPIAPRPAPKNQLDSAARALGHPIPDWVAALWSCKVILGGCYFADVEARDLGTHIVETTRAAHAGGAPQSVVFFAGSAMLHPGTDVYDDRGKRFVKGDLDSFVHGFEPAHEREGPPRVITYLHTAFDPAKRLERTDLVSFVRDLARSARRADDHDVFSEETYASILATREAPRPPFELRWELRTPGIAAPASEPATPVRVQHAKFGVGTVLSREGQGDAEKVTVQFAEGTKTLLARFVKPVD